MKSAFDEFFGGKLSSRAQMAERIRNMKTDGSVITEAMAAINSRTPVQVIEDREKFKKYRKATLLRKEQGGAPYVGDIFGFEAK